MAQTTNHEDNTNPDELTGVDALGDREVAPTAAPGLESQVTSRPVRHRRDAILVSGPQEPESGAPSGEGSGDGQEADKPEQPRGLWARFMTGISRNVLVLGLVSFFTDISSEMIVPVRILFLVVTLHTPLPLAGLIEGIAESTASLLKIVSGRVADRASSRKPLILFGYSASNAAKPLLALVTSWPSALLLIFVDRVGKGVRGSPRDAMMADSTPREYMGKAFGFHRSMDTLGAAVGPLLAYLVLLLSNNDLRAVFGWTAVPGALSVLVILLFLREKRQVANTKAGGMSVAGTVAPARPRVPASALGTRFWMFTAITTVFALGNSSDAFIFLRTAGLEQSVLLVPVIYFLYNFVYAALATPLGALSDRWGRLPVLISGYTAFALVYTGWALATQAWNAWALFLIYGVYAAATEGVGKAYVTDLVPKEARASALGWFNGLSGFAALPANFIGGWLWSVAGPSTTFAFGAWTAALSMALVIAWLPWLRKREEPVPVAVAARSEA
jgi:MFS family permease